MSFILAFSSFMLQEGMIETVYADPDPDPQPPEYVTAADDWALATLTDTDGDEQNDSVVLDGYVGS